MNPYERERYSVCIVYSFEGPQKTYRKYYRVADYDPKEGELIPALVEADARSLEEARDNPDHLYNPMADWNHDKRDSDIYLFQWRLDPDEPGKQLTRSFYDDTSLLAIIEEPKEVIVPESVSSESDLRISLSAGIPFDGKTTNIFYLVFAKDGDDLLAAKCRKADFLFNDGVLKPISRIESARATVRSVPVVRLKSYDILESPHADTGHRKIYAKLEELPDEGSILIRPLDYFASDYVKWFIKEEGLSASKSERRVIAPIIQTAFERPDALEKYLGTGNVNQQEIDDFLRIVADTAVGNDTLKDKIKSALLADETLRQECLEEVLASCSKEIDAKKRELCDVAAEVSDAWEKADAAQSELENRRNALESLRSEISDAEAELASVEKEYAVAMEEVESNIALRIGLRTVARTSSSPAEADVIVEEGPVVVPSLSEKDFSSVVEGNMKALGLISIFGNADEERRCCALGMAAARSASRILVAPAPQSYALADALSIAICGNSAKRVFVPSDCRDWPSIFDAIGGDDAVTVVENVIDSANEGVLFKLLSADLSGTIVLSFVSHESFRLIAPEAWERAFVLPAEGLVVYSNASRIGKLHQCASLEDAPKIDMDDVVSGAKDLLEDLEEATLTYFAAIIPATVVAAAEEIEEDVLVERIVAQHLLAVSGFRHDALDCIQSWCDDDRGLLNLAKRAVEDE